MFFRISQRPSSTNVLKSSYLLKGHFWLHRYFSPSEHIGINKCPERMFACLMNVWRMFNKCPERMFASFPISCPIKMIADACAASFSICCSCITLKRMQWMHFSCYERTSQYTLLLSISSSVTNHLRQCRHRKCLLYLENFLKVTRNTHFTWRAQCNESEGIASGYVPPPSSSSSLSPPISASLSSPPSSALSSPSQSSPLELTSCSRSKQFSAWSSAFLNRKIID